MKRHFLTGLKALAVSALALAAVSCYDDSELWGELDKHAGEIAGLEERVAALEAKLNSEVATLNGTISALEGKVTAADKALEEKLNKSLTDLAAKLDAKDAEVAADIKEILAQVAELKEGLDDVPTYDAVLEALKKKDSELGDAIADQDKALADKAKALEDALTALEKKLGADLADLNDELLAELAAALESVAVQKVEEKDGSVVVTLASGKTITLAKPDANANNTGLVTIVDGEWHVVLEDGTTKSLDVPVGVEEIEFQVNYETMELEFSVNGGEFVGTGAFVADDFEYYVTGYAYEEDNYVVLEIGGKEYNLPKVSEATAAILAGKTYFAAEASKVFPISVDGVKSAFVASVPEGWTAAVDMKELELTVTAPAVGDGAEEGVVEVWLLTEDGTVISASVAVAIGEAVIDITVDPVTNEVSLTFNQVDGETPEVIYGFTLASKFNDDFLMEIMADPMSAPYMYDVYSNLDQANPDTAPKATSASGKMSDFVKKETLDYNAEYVVWAFCPEYNATWACTNSVNDFYKAYHKMNALTFESTSSIDNVEFTLELLDEKATGFYGFYAKAEYWEMIQQGYIPFEGLLQGQFGQEMPCTLYEGKTFTGDLKTFGLSEDYLGYGISNTVVPNCTALVGIIPVVEGKDTYTIDDVIMKEVKTDDVVAGGTMTNTIELTGRTTTTFTVEVTAADAKWIFYDVYAPGDIVPADDAAVVALIAKGDINSVDEFYYGAYEGSASVTHHYSYGEAPGTEYTAVFAFIGADGKATIVRGNYATMTYEEEFREKIEKAAEGATVKLTRDITLTASLPIEKKITLDLNNKKITSEHTVFYIKPSGDLTVSNGTVTTAGNVFYNNGTLTINGGTYTTTGDLAATVYCDGPIVDGNSTDAPWHLTINDGAFVSEKQTAISLQNNYYGLDPEGSATLNGGTFKGVSEGAGYDLYVGCAKVTYDPFNCTFENARFYTVAIPGCSAWINGVEYTTNALLPIVTPAGKQFTWQDEYGDSYIMDLGYTDSDILYYPCMDYDEYMGGESDEYMDPIFKGKLMANGLVENLVIVPTSPTSGKITGAVELYNPGLDEIVSVKYMILYGNLNESSVELYSPSQLGEEEGYSGMGIVAFDESFNLLPLEASVVATPKEAVYMDMGVAM